MDKKVKYSLITIAIIFCIIGAVGANAGLYPLDSVPEHEKPAIDHTVFWSRMDFVNQYAHKCQSDLKSHGYDKNGNCEKYSRLTQDTSKWISALGSNSRDAIFNFSDKIKLWSLVDTVTRIMWIDAWRVENGSWDKRK